MMCRIKDWFIHLLILSTDQKKAIVYQSDQFKKVEIKQITHLTVNIWFKCCTEKILVYLFSAYFITVYVSFMIVKNYGFVMGFIILAIYFQLKTTIFNVKT